MSAKMTFELLRAANIARLPTFKNKRGELAHPPQPGVPPGYDWALSKWANAELGELGEAANIIKKIERGDLTLEDARPELAKELADVQCYLDLLAHRAGVDLGEATRAKFNEISERVDSPIFIMEAPDGECLVVVDKSYFGGRVVVGSK